MTLTELQQLIEKMYSAKDRARGPAGTFLWLAEEIGELASAIGDKAPKKELAEEFADVLAWLATLANVMDVDLDTALAKYATGCPGCKQMVCRCSEKE
ncbi:MAG: MazG nucleotide pyrophosphohydrolase domain-containing protein [Phycisphaerae bacterium]|nr:MazG nucleotide pyrophosphohydrolase domain-containing protein [Phycisphaerae bacterium]